MSNKVTCIEDYRLDPHITVVDLVTNNVHVLPIKTLYDLSHGSIKIDDIEEFEPLIRAVLSDYVRILIDDQ